MPPWQRQLTWSNTVEYFLAIALVLLFFTVITFVARRFSTSDLATQGERPYQSKKALLSFDERAFLTSLEQAVGGRYRVFAKVRLADILTPRKNLPHHDWRRAFERIANQQADFVLCRSTDLFVQAVIRLHDKHRQSRRERFVDRALEAAGIPVIRIEAQPDYRAEQLSAAVNARLSRSGSGALTAGSEQVASL